NARGSLTPPEGALQKWIAAFYLLGLSCAMRTMRPAPGRSPGPTRATRQRAEGAPLCPYGSGGGPLSLAAPRTFGAYRVGLAHYRVCPLAQTRGRCRGRGRPPRRGAAAALKNQARAELPGHNRGAGARRRPRPKKNQVVSKALECLKLPGEIKKYFGARDIKMPTPERIARATKQSRPPHQLQKFRCLKNDYTRPFLGKSTQTGQKIFSGPAGPTDKFLLKYLHKSSRTFGANIFRPGNFPRAERVVFRRPPQPGRPQLIVPPGAGRRSA